MTVTELIAELNKWPGAAKVLILDFDGCELNLLPGSADLQTDSQNGNDILWITAVDDE